MIREAKPFGVDDFSVHCDRQRETGRASRDLASPSGNRLEPLRGDSKGQYSIRANDQRRICFEWRDSDVYEVEIVDYH